MSSLLLKQKRLLVRRRKFFFDIERVDVAIKIKPVMMPIICVVTYESFLLKTPIRLRTVLSQHCAISERTIDPRRGFSLIIPSHKETPSFIASLVKIANGISTR